MAAPGIQSTEARINTVMSNIAHIGHECRTVNPLDGTQASYPDPSTAISTKLATRIEIIAKGDKYFQQINQYKPGRWPVINSMSSANLEVKK